MKSRADFIKHCMIIANNSVGKELTVKLHGNNAVRKGEITRVEFDSMKQTSPCYETCIFRVWQAIPKADGTGTVERSVLMRVANLPR